ncbi:hypothetical protein G4B84_002075 [Aspergillus flavus NRRL3357]|nr:uncharacterized protein G4B84_002075 [Aspergillus flavus NRRL3357]QMW26830.1 hypothetical protein G4B84_002075 [Aspergillus flavus NRRL3357]
MLRPAESITGSDILGDNHVIHTVKAKGPGVIRRIWLKKFGIPRTMNALRGQWYRAQWGWVPQVGSEKTPPADVKTTAETESSDELPQATSRSPEQPSREKVTFQP